MQNKIFKPKPSITVYSHFFIGFATTIVLLFIALTDKNFQALLAVLPLGILVIINALSSTIIHLNSYIEVSEDGVLFHRCAHREGEGWDLYTLTKKIPWEDVRTVMTTHRRIILTNDEIYTDAPDMYIILRKHHDISNMEELQASLFGDVWRCINDYHKDYLKTHSDRVTSTPAQQTGVTKTGRPD